MELFTIALQSSSKETIEMLSVLLNEHAADLHMTSQSGAYIDYQIGSEQSIVCSALMPEFKLTQHGPDVYRKAAIALSEYVIRERETGMLASIIRRKYRYKDTSDTKMIERYCHDLLHGSDWDGFELRYLDADRQRRRAKVADELEAYLDQHTHLNIDGFINFRLNSYRKELTEVVEYALDEYVLDKQYQEFISLLKYFVCLQETKHPIVHLMHKGGHEFTLLDEKLLPIDTKSPSDRIVAEMLETEMNVEDMVISSLIAASPKEILIHTRQPELQAIRTIETIFESRVSICVECSSCSTRLGEVIQP
ncbi:putative sporulation protein YtxC [Paenibacillus sp. GCM10023252]|uniref:putative sporulation protein YtxC n=1 Tax=Paenibacillus sp. GCM10023252 TaxID=3252649 RepID=UPI00361AA360